jgi:hypothetical protein
MDRPVLDRLTSPQGLVTFVLWRFAVSGTRRTARGARALDRIAGDSVPLRRSPLPFLPALREPHDCPFDSHIYDNRSSEAQRGLDHVS